MLRLTRAELKTWAEDLDRARSMISEARVVAFEVGERIIAEDLEEAARYVGIARNFFSWMALSLMDEETNDE